MWICEQRRPFMPSQREFKCILATQKFLVDKDTHLYSDSLWGRSLEQCAQLCKNSNVDCIITLVEARGGEKSNQDVICRRIDESQFPKHCIVIKMNLSCISVSDFTSLRKVYYECIRMVPLNSILFQKYYFLKHEKRVVLSGYQRDNNEEVSRFAVELRFLRQMEHSQVCVRVFMTLPHIKCSTVH